MAGSQSEGPGIVARWRVRGDEVQVNQAIAAVCQDPAVAAAFVRTVLEIASHEPQCGPRAAAVLDRVPDSLRCEEQSRLPEQRRRALLRERRHAGIADLDFFDDESDFRLMTELKIDAPAGSIGGGRTQLDSYVQIAPVVAVARQPLPAPEENDHNWLGTVRWRQLAGRLEGLPIAAETLRHQWLELLRVMDEDGDFKDEAPKTSRSTEVARVWLEANKGALRTALAEATTAGRRNGVGKQERTTFADAIRVSKVSADRDSVAVAFRPPEGSKGAVAGPIFIVVVPAYARAPRAIVIWWPPSNPPRWKRGDRDADAASHQALVASEFIQAPNLSYRYTSNTPTGRVREVGLDALLPELNRALTAIGKSGVLKACVAGWLR